MQRRHKPRRRHRAGHTDLALAPHLRPRNRGILLIEHADSTRREQKADHAVIVGARFEALVEVQHRRYDARRAVRGRGDDATTGRVLLVDRKCPGIDPIHDVERACGALVLDEHAVELGRATAHFENAGQQSRLPKPAFHACLHDVPEAQQSGTHFRLGSPRALIRHHEFKELKGRLAGAPQKLIAGVKRVWRR